MSWRPIRVLEIRSVRGTGGGPEKTILLGASQADRTRVHVTVCYIRDARDHVFEIDGRAAALGVDYVEIVERHSFDPSVWPAVRRLIRDRSIDIVHAHDYKTNLLARLVNWRDGVRVLSTAHGWTGHSVRERHFYYPADKRLLVGFPRVIAVSSEIKSELLRRGARAERVTVVLNGIDHVTFRRHPEREPEARSAWGLGPDDVVLGAVGRLEPQKRFDLLLEAFARLRSRRPDLRLLIAGDGSLRAELSALVATLELESTCRLVGHVSDVTRFHHALDIFVQSSDYEGTPNAVLEAMAFGTPLVATTAGGTAELATDGVHGLLVQPGDAGRLADAIDRLLADRVRASSYARMARRRVEGDLSFATRMAKVDAIYAEVAQRGHREAEVA